MDKATLIKARTFDKIIDHLHTASKDRRSRERKRAKIAIRTIDEWIAESTKEIYG